MISLKDSYTFLLNRCVIALLMVLLMHGIIIHPKSPTPSETRLAKKYIENYLSDIKSKKNRKKEYSRQSKKPKLLFVENIFPPVTSTAALNQLISLLDSKKFDITICAKKNGLSNWSHPDIERYGLMSREKLFIGKLPPDLHEYDIIFCQFGNIGSAFVKIKQRLRLKAKIVTCFRGCDITRNIKDDPHLYDKLFTYGDLFLPVCDFFRKKLIDLGCDAHKIQVIHSTIDCDKFRFSPTSLRSGSSINITTICRLIEKKGVEDSIMAVARLIRRYPNIHLTIIGFGPLKHKLEQLINDLGASKNITLAGRYSQEKIIQALQDTHIFILPCLTAKNDDAEGIPNALKEAMATGIPVISTFHAGIPELVEDGISGFLIEEKDHRTLSKKIEFLIKNPHVWHTMGTAGRKKIMNSYEKHRENKRLLTTLLGLIDESEIKTKITAEPEVIAEPITEPVIIKPVITKPVKPVIIKPIKPKPIKPKPIKRKSIVTKLVIPKPVVTKPIITKPVITKPAITKPVIIKTITAQPIIDPAITKPIITEPIITEPIITEPVITEPVIIEPVIIEPVVTEHITWSPQQEPLAWVPQHIRMGLIMNEE